MAWETVEHDEDIRVVFDDGSERVYKGGELSGLHWLEKSAVENPANGEPGFAVIKSADEPVVKSGGPTIFDAFNKLLKGR